MRVVLDTTILVRAHDGAKGLARDLVATLIESDHVIILSNEMLYELARVLRYPRMTARHRQTEEEIYHFVSRLRVVSELVEPNPFVFAPVRDLNDTVVLQTAICGDVDVLCTNDRDFFESPASEFLRYAGIEVMSDITLMHRLRM